MGIISKFEQLSINIYEFITKYQYIILIGFFSGILVNVIDVFTIKFGMDSEAYALVNSPQIYVNQQRYGSYLLYHILPIARYHIISHIIGIMALTLASLITVSRHNISNNVKLLFVLIFVTYPNFAFLQYFYFQSAYNFIGLLFVVIAYRLIEKNNIISYIFALLLLFIGISSYQSNFSVFLVIMMINVILDYLKDNDINKAVLNIIKSTTILVISVIIYYITIKLLAGSFNNHHSKMVGYQYGLDYAFSRLTEQIVQTIFSYGPHGYFTANILVTLLLVMLLSYIIIKTIKNHRFIYIIIFILLWLLAIFSMNIIMGNSLTIRVLINYAFYPAFIVLLSFLLFKKKIYQILLIIMTICMITVNGYYIVKNQMAHYMYYKQDVKVANSIMEKIYSKVPDSYNKGYKIAFHGKIIPNIHPLMKDAKYTFNLTFFNAFGGRPDRMLGFLKLNGFPTTSKLVNINEELKTIVDKMPSYPNNNCVRLHNDVIIVKLR